MDPLGTIETILTVCQAIYAQVELAKTNKARCRRLKQRIDVVYNSIKDLIIPKFNKEMNEATRAAVRDKIKQAYAVPLQGLLDTLYEAMALIGKFKADKRFILNFLKAGFDNDEFNDIYEKLNEDLGQLKLGLSTQILFNQEQDMADRKNDYEELISHEKDILNEAMEMKKGMQKLAMQHSEQALVLKQQEESMRQALERMNPARQKEVSEKLLISFHELDIDRLLAKGSFGNIYLGRWMGQEVVIKVVEAVDEEITKAQRDEFLREVNIMKDLRSEFVVPLYAVCLEKHRACIVMKHMHKGSLRSLLAGNTVNMSLAEKDELIFEMALGLNYLHRKGILHRDFNSENILLDAGGHAAITDFGLSKKDSMHTILNKKSSNSNWMAPEVLMIKDSTRSFTKASDVYSFGMVVWEVLTGKKPYADKREHEVCDSVTNFQQEEIPANIPEFYKELLKVCWEKNRWSRPTMFEIVQRLEERLRLQPQPQMSTVQPERGNQGFFPRGVAASSARGNTGESYTSSSSSSSSSSGSSSSFAFNRGRG